ncbi:hypothetical protein [Nonomuraea endophytica]|uniref:VWA domain-containing protein n=1 Tax=Nonomuraea endophytica TaxID=714136 RepID=A0A7W8EMG4_9ACTN|nr:hypothetical protein [Nonomuraea endophytica]MBB5084984.1 hypothetical protein [Nonomuraea endophytica]
MTTRKRIAGLLAVACLAGCVHTEQQSQVGAGDPCAVMSRPGATPVSTNIVLVDRSGSTLAKDPAAFVPNWAASLLGVLPVRDGEQYLIAPFAGGNYLSFPDEPLAAPPIRGTSKKQKPLKDAVRACLKLRVTGAVLKPGIPKGTDILGALHAAGRQLAGLPPGSAKHIFVATDGYASTGCAEIKMGRRLSDGDITRIADGCAGELPTSVSGIPITLVGIGTASSKMRAVLPDAVTSLARLWDTLCRRMTTTCTVVSGAPTDDASAIAG